VRDRAGQEKSTGSGEAQDTTCIFFSYYSFYFTSNIYRIHNNAVGVYPIKCLVLILTASILQVNVKERNRVTKGVAGPKKKTWGRFFL
jgi:hypothetical protein